MEVLEWLGRLVVLAAGFAMLNRSIGKRIDDLETDLSQRIDDFETDLGQRISDFETGLGQRIEGVAAEGEKAHASIGQAIRESERRIVETLGRRIDDLKDTLATRR